MANFCPHCGRPLEEGETCTCQKTDSGVVLSLFPEDAAAPASSRPHFTYDPEPTYQSPYDTQEPVSAAEPPVEEPDAEEAAIPRRQHRPRHKAAPSGAQHGERGKEILARILQEAQHLSAQLLPLLLRPVSYRKELALAEHPALGWEWMGIRAIFALILTLAGISDLLGGLTVPLVFQLIFLVLLLTVGMDALTAFLLHLFPSLLRGKFSFSSSVVIVGTRCLYDSLSLLLGGLFLLIHPGLGLVILLIGSLLSLSIEYAGFLETCSKLHRDRAPYVYALVKAVVLLLSYLILALLARQILTSLFTSVINSLVLLSAASMT